MHILQKGSRKSLLKHKEAAQKVKQRRKMQNIRKYSFRNINL
jgi:hypothetical protein